MIKKILFIFIFSIILSSCATTQQSQNSISQEKKINNGANYYSAAVAYLGVKNYEFAKINFLKSIKTHYNLVGAYYYLGIIEYEENNLDLSEKYLLNCIKLDDKITDAHNTLGAIYAKKKQFKKAIEEFKKVLKDSSYLYPENALYNLALLYYNLNKFNESIKYCQKCLFIVPKSPAVYYLLGLNHFKKHDVKQTKFYMFQIIKEFPDNLWATKAKIFLKQNKLR
jgi:tetratricopeptide (TPR) repeat protein